MKAFLPFFFVSKPGCRNFHIRREYLCDQADCARQQDQHAGGFQLSTRLNVQLQVLFTCSSVSRGCGACLHAIRCHLVLSHLPLTYRLIICECITAPSIMVSNLTHRRSLSLWHIRCLCWCGQGA